MTHSTVCVNMILIALSLLVCGSFGYQSSQVVKKRQLTNDISASWEKMKQQRYHGYGLRLKDNGTGCSCVGYECGCCAHLNVPEFKLNDTGCVNITYLPSPDYGVSLTFSINGHIYYNYTTSARNPPPLCFGFPVITEKLASICLKFYNMNVSNYTLSGCLRIEVKLETIVLKDFDLGCFKIPPRVHRHQDQNVQPRSKVTTGLRLKDNGTGCSCVGYNCGCCADLNVPRIKLNDTGCVNITYLPSPDYGISITFSIDGHVYYNYTVSARNPPPLCFGIPKLEKLASLCLKFYNMNVSNYSLSGCLMIEARLEGLLLKDFDLGCFKIPPTVHRHQDETLRYRSRSKVLRGDAFGSLDGALKKILMELKRRHGYKGPRV